MLVHVVHDDAAVSRRATSAAPVAGVRVAVIPLVPQVHSNRAQMSLYMYMYRDRRGGTAA